MTRDDGTSMVYEMIDERETNNFEIQRCALIGQWPWNSLPIWAASASGRFFRLPKF